MTDITPLNLPPRDLGPIEGLKPVASPAAQPTEKALDFQEILLKTLGNVSRDTDRLEKASTPSYEEMPRAMEDAKNAFAETMQAHQLMQNLLQGFASGPAGTKADSPAGE